MKKIISICIVICLLFLTGCGGEVFKKREKIGDKMGAISSNLSYLTINGANCVTDTGKYYEERSLLYYLDFETMQSMVVCSKPDCRHYTKMEDINSTCNALLDRISYLFYYNDKLHFIYVNLKEVKTEVYQADKDASNRKKIAEYNFYAGNQIILSNDKLYISSADPLNTETDADFNSLNNTVSIHCIDMKNMKDVDIYSERQIKSAGYSIYGIYNNKIIYSYKNEDVGDLVDQYYIFDKASKEERKILDNTEILPGGMDQQFFYYSKNGEMGINVFDIDTLEDKNLFRMDQKPSEEGITQKLTYIQLWDHKVFYYAADIDKNGKAVNANNHLYYFNPQTGETDEPLLGKQINSKDKTNMEIRYEYKDRFIFKIFTGDSFDGVDAWISKEDFYNGELDYNTI